MIFFCEVLPYALGALAIAFICLVPFMTKLMRSDDGDAK